MEGANGFFDMSYMFNSSADMVDGKESLDGIRQTLGACG